MPIAYEKLESVAVIALRQFLAGPHRGSQFGDTPYSGNPAHAHTALLSMASTLNKDFRVARFPITRYSSKRNRYDGD